MLCLSNPQFIRLRVIGQNSVELHHSENLSYSFFLCIFLWEGDSNEGNKRTKFSKINDQNFVIKADGRGSGMFLLWLIQLKLTLTKSFLCQPIFILSSVHACHIQFRFTDVGHYFNFTTTSFMCPVNTNFCRFYLLSQMLLNRKVNLFCLLLLFSLQHNLSCV